MLYVKINLRFICLYLGFCTVFINYLGDYF
jgi:hypothetical protein